jgi:glycosyltransferase involved in cell wall biosynthesis
VANQPLRILQVNTEDISGGAAFIAWNLFQTYRARGYGSWLAVEHKHSDDPDVLLIPNRELHGMWARFCWDIHYRLQRLDKRIWGARWFSDWARRLADPCKSLDGYCGFEDFHFPGTWQLTQLTPKRPDIVHSHNLHGGYFDLRVLPWLSQQVPVVLTLHDAWLLSGHCAHSLDCERWKTGCGHCPDLTLYPAIRRDATAYNWRRKREIYADSRLYVATPSQWLMQKVEQSMLAPAVVEAQVIPNGVDLSTFHPADKRVTRAALGIPQASKVLLFTANAVRQNVWKDYQTVRDAVALTAERMSGQAVLFLALGEDALAERIGPAEVRFVPYQTDPEVVARYYQAADVYVHATRADTFPNTVLEALACGTPVVATAVGGIPEQVEDARTGFLVPAGDAKALAARLVQMLSDDALRQNMGVQAAEAARCRFDLCHQADIYLDWYHELAKQRASAPWAWESFATSSCNISLPSGQS